jgi:Tol biopolymer transport system component
MPIPAKSKLIPALLVVAALLALPAAASATLAYNTNIFNPHIWVAKNDDGKGAKAIGAGSSAKVSPDGELVVFEREESNGKGPDMKLYDVATGKTKTIFSSWRESYSFAWSSDSTMVAALRGGELGKRTLYVVDVETGKLTRIATGYFNGVSFSPTSEEIVYGVAPTFAYPPKSTLYREGIDGTGKVALSHDNISAYPLWGPKGQIVFARQLGAKSRKYGPANQLFVMNEDGQQISQVTHTKVDPLAQGLVPVAFSANGARLLTEFGGQDQGYGVAVSLVTGGEKKLTDDPETGFQGSGLTADGSTILGTTGLGFGPSHPKIVTMPWGGGPEKLLVANAYFPSWSE